MIYISKCEIKMLMIICAYLASNFCNPCSPPNPNIIVLEGTQTLDTILLLSC